MTTQHMRDVVAGKKGNYRVLDSVSGELGGEDLLALKNRLKFALNRYPELIGKTVTVGKKREEDKWYAEADWVNDIIFVPTHELCPYVTICHELSHLAIKNLSERGVDVPITSEEYCSIFTYARLSQEEIDEPYISYLGEPSVPKHEWAEICQRALEYRQEHRNYIQKCKEWLEV